MAYPGAPKDGKSDVDRPFLPERQGQAKQAFDKSSAGQEKAVTAQQSKGDQGKLPESIKRNAPGMDLDMPGGGAIKANQHRSELSKEAATAKRENAMKKVASKKMDKSNGIEQNKSQSQNNGRE